MQFNQRQETKKGEVREHREGVGFSLIAFCFGALIAETGRSGAAVLGCQMAGRQKLEKEKLPTLFPVLFSSQTECCRIDAQYRMMSV